MNTASRQDFGVEVSKGNVWKHSAYQKWGKNVDIDAGVMEYVWYAGGVYAWTTVGETVGLVSTSAQDGVVGTGWQKCLVYGLNSDYERISEIVTLNGTTPVNTVNEYIFIYRCNDSITYTVFCRCNCEWR